LPSPPSDPYIQFRCGENQECVLEVKWSPSLDSGIGANSSTPLPLTYSLRIFKNQDASATQPIDNSCPAFDSLTATAVFGMDDLGATNMTVSGLVKGSIYCIYIRARNSRLQLYSSPAVRMIRPISPPLAPTQLQFLLNPSNLANLTASPVPGFVNWRPPDDAGAGPGIPLPIVAYHLEMLPCDANAPFVNETTVTASLPYSFAYRCLYLLRVAALNEQDASLGAFSAWGPYQNISIYVSQVPHASRIAQDE
jgi:hypothetical protein